MESLEKYYPCMLFEKYSDFQRFNPVTFKPETLNIEEGNFVVRKNTNPNELPDVYKVISVISDYVDGLMIRKLILSDFTVLIREHSTDEELYFQFGNSASKFLQHRQPKHLFSLDEFLKIAKYINVIKQKIEDEKYQCKRQNASECYDTCDIL